jgi:hypothetical protein
MTTLLKSTEPKARKVHRCLWCYGKIEVGEKHLYQVVVDHGDFMVARWHFKCIDKPGNDHDH